MSAFFDALSATGPVSDRNMQLYAWLIGDWRFDATHYDETGTATKGAQGEIHFGWALQGRAIQDVWILPARDQPNPGSVFYGTTLRIYDPAIDAWHILWNDPVKMLLTRQLGRAQGADIVQVGDDGKGTALRWTFSEISAESFRWFGEKSADGGKNWLLQVEFRARRDRRSANLL
jgi:hypothetical protein